LKIKCVFTVKANKYKTLINENEPKIKNILKELIEKFIKLEIFRESWEELKVCKTNLVLLKIIAFENAWKIIWKIIKPKFIKIILKHIKPNWLVVENATTFFKSNQNVAKILENIEVKIPKIPKIKIKLKLYVKDKSIDKVTPATTIVDECKSEDTGVGPSIAIGNHQLKIKREDLPKIEKHKIKSIVKFKILKLKFKIKINIIKSLKRL